MKNILIIISGLKIGGGASTSASMLGNELSKKGYNINFLTFYKFEKEYKIEGKNNCLNFSKQKNIFLRFFQIIKKSYYIKKYSKKENIDICLSFGEEENLANIWSRVFFGNKSKIITSIRSSIDVNNGKIGRFFLKTFLKKADFIVPIVKEETQNLIQNYGIKPEKVQNIYNMFDIKNIQEKSKEDLGKHKELFNNGNFTFINVGRLSKQKNQKLLLNAFDKFHQKNPNTQLIILGDGELKEELKNRQKSLSSKEDIHFLGVYENPYKFLANADAFIFSSFWEGMGRVLVEAMECGLPIISTDCKVGPKEVLRKNPTNFEMVNGVSKEKYGILLQVDDEKSLTQAMQDLYDDKDLQEYYSKQSRLRSKDFDVEKIISEWESVLR